MSKLVLHVQAVHAHTWRDAHAAIREMQALADRLSVNVSAEVGTIHLTCSPGDDATERCDFFDRNATRRGIEQVSPIREAQ